MNSIVCNNPAIHTPNPGRQIVVFPTIQEAIDHAEEWDSIFVEPGTYHENIVVNKVVEIYSNCMDECTIIGDGMSPTMSITHDDVKLSELTLSGGGAGQSGILASGVRHTKLNRVTCSGSKNGLELVGSGDNWIVSCVFSGNTEYGFKASAGSDGNNVTDCFATGNGNGFGFFDSARNRPSNNSAYANTNIGFNMVNCSLSVFVTNMSQYSVVGVSFDGSDGNTFITGSIGYCGTGIRLINSDDNLIYSTPVTYPSTVVDLSLDAASNTNTIAHNFYTTHTDLGTGNRFQNNHINAPSRDTDVATVSYVNALPYLATQLTSVLYVDGKRTDTYTETGTITKPFKTVGAAIAVAPPYSTVKIAAKSDGLGNLLAYVENLIIPASVSLEGDQSVIIEGDVALAATGSPTRLRGIMFSGAAKTLTLRGSVSIWDCVATCAVVYDSAAASQAWNFHLLPSASGVVPLTMLSTGKFQSCMASIISKGNVPAIDQRGGSLILNTVLATAGRVGGPVVVGTGGTVAFVAAQVINSLGGTAFDISANGATASNPNMLAGVVAVGNAICGAKTTMVEGINFITTGALSGTSLIFREAIQIKNIPAGTILATDIQSAINELDTEKPTISTGTAAPATTPTKVGDIFVDTNNKKLYFAVGTESSADWIAS
jgi:hypothetical protein